MYRAGEVKSSGRGRLLRVPAGAGNRWGFGSPGNGRTPATPAISPSARPERDVSRNGPPHDCGCAGGPCAIPRNPCVPRRFAVIIDVRKPSSGGGRPTFLSVPCVVTRRRAGARVFHVPRLSTGVPRLPRYARGAPRNPHVSLRSSVHDCGESSVDRKGKDWEFKAFRGQGGVVTGSFLLNRR